MKEKIISIKKQWETYFKWINYNIFIKQQFKKVKKISLKSTKELNEKIKEHSNLIDREKEYIGKVNNINDVDKSLKLFLTSKEIIKQNPLKRFFEQHIFKFDGYIFYLNKAEDLRIFKIKNLKYLHKLKNNELYALEDKEGIFKGKPFFLIKYPTPISLTIDENGDFFYDCESFNNYVNSATKTNLTNLGEKFNIAEFVKSNLVLILIGIALILLFTTPEGAKFLEGIIK